MHRSLEASRFHHAAWREGYKATRVHQAPAVPVIGFLHDPLRDGVRAQEGPSETGYIEGRNAAIEYR